MRLRRTALGVVVNFLLGVAWAFVFLGAFYTFLSFYHQSIVNAALMTFLGALPGLFVVVLLEHVIVGMQRLEELKKQTALLEKFTSR